MNRNFLTAVVIIAGLGNAWAVGAPKFDVNLLQGWAAESAVFVPAADIPAFEVVKVADAGQTSNARKADIVNERNQLFMLAAMSYAYVHRADFPAPGYDIAALIAWDVENVNLSPAFVMNRNRNFENEGSKYHAEQVTIDKAYEALKNFLRLPDSFLKPEAKAALSKKLANTHLYTTLEPCPQCHSTILMAGIPEATYCMDDPGLRDPQTHQPLKDADYQMTNRAYGYKYSGGPSSLALCVGYNDGMWRDTVVWADGRHPQWGRYKYFSITDYIHDQAGAMYKPAFETLSAFKTQFPENQELLEGLKKVVGKPSTAAQ